MRDLIPLSLPYKLYQTINKKKKNADIGNALDTSSVLDQSKGRFCLST